LGGNLWTTFTSLLSPNTPVVPTFRWLCVSVLKSFLCPY
jgi:hypothetical protein